MIKDKKLRCIYCGKFVKYDKRQTGTIFEPDTHFGPEVVEHYHKKCESQRNK